MALRSRKSRRSKTLKKYGGANGSSRGSSKGSSRGSSRRSSKSSSRRSQGSQGNMTIHYFDRTNDKHLSTIRRKINTPMTIGELRRTTDNEIFYGFGPVKGSLKSLKTVDQSKLVKDVLRNSKDTTGAYVVYIDGPFKSGMDEFEAEVTRD